MKTNLREITGSANSSVIDELIDFRSLIYSFWENRYTLLIITSIVTSLAIIYTLIKTPEYESNIIIHAGGKSNSSLSLSQHLGLPGSTTSESATQAALIKSRFILEPVVNRLGVAFTVSLHQTPIIGRFIHSNDSLKVKLFEVPNSYYEKKFALTTLDAKHYQLSLDGKTILRAEVGKLAIGDQGVRILVNELHAKPGAKFDILHHSTLGCVDSLISRIQVSELNDGSGGRTGILQVSMKHFNTEYLVSALNTMAKVIQEKDAEQKSLETAKTLEFLELQLPLVKADLASAETIYNRYRARSGKMDIKFEISHLMILLSDIEKQITNISITKADLLQRFTAKYPVILGLDNKILQLNKQKAYLETRVRTLPASDQAMATMLRDIKVKNSLYLILLNKIHELKVMKAGTISDVRILAFATVPDAPLSKKTPIVVAAAMMLGLMIACLFVIGRKAFFRCVNDPHWLEKSLNIHNLAIVPYSKQQVMNMQDFKQKKVPSIGILAEKYSKDLSVESLRSLRTSFQITMTSATNNIMSIMGVTQNIGKSFISVNFSYLLASASRRVLLIDGDIRKGHLHDYFKVPQTMGLSEAISNHISIEQAIHKTTNPNLDFISCGNYPHNPSELLMEKNFVNIMNFLSQQYDLIIIDTAPILAVTDSTIIGSIASMNLLVVGANVHQPEEITQAIKRIDSANVKLMGTIFNILKADVSMRGNYRSNYYSTYEDDSQKHVAKVS